MNLNTLMAWACYGLGAVAGAYVLREIISVYLVAHIEGDLDRILAMHYLLGIIILCMTIGICFWRTTPAHER